jgi:hypothetical protein
MPRLLAIVLFLVLTPEGEKGYIGDVHTPLAYPTTLLFSPSSLKLPLWTYIQLGILLAYGGKGESPRLRTKPLDRALLASVLCVIGWVALGAARGGDLNQAGFQVFALLNGLLFAFVLMAVMRTPAHYAMLLRAVLAAALYRAFLVIGLYAFVVRNLTWDKVGECVTTHDDSVLFVAGLTILLVGALLGTSKSARLHAWLGAPPLLLAIQLNNRRLAWVSLVAALVVIYVCMPPSPKKRAVTRAALWAVPVIALYVAVGWGRTERVFKPLQAFATMSSNQDLSTKSRDNENDGLIYTFGQSGAFGAGFGIQYTETDTTLSARVFSQYRYIPHNSVLGLLAFTGALGFAGILMPLPIAVFLSTRTSRIAADPRARAAAIIAVAFVAICLNQMYGDMGLFSQTTIAILAIAIATGGRLSAATGAWPVRGAARRGEPEVGR